MTPCAVSACVDIDSEVANPAAPGLLVCWKHRDALMRAPRRAAIIWYQLGERLVASGSSALEPKVRASRIPGLDLDHAVVGRRDQIMACLASWAGYITEKRGLPAPEREPVALAGFLTHTRNVDWLAASDAATAAVEELSFVAFGVPEPAAIRPALPCPLCEASPIGQLRVLPADGGVVACDLDNRHTWKASEWLTLKRLLTSV